MQRRGSAFALLQGEASEQLHQRLQQEEKEVSATGARFIAQLNLLSFVQAELEAARIEAEKKKTAQVLIVCTW